MIYHKLIKITFLASYQIKTAYESKPKHYIERAYIPGTNNLEII